jgi:hypothetical protein
MSTHIRSTPAPIATEAKQQRIYTFQVFIIDGPLTAEFLDANPMIARKIEMLGSQTLADLHRTIFDAFDRQEEHLYEFQIGGKGPHDPANRLYVLASAMKREDDAIHVAGDVETVTLNELGLTVNEPFGYWFDFGDDWWHQINVVSITECEFSGSYPRVIERVGMSPPQSLDWDESDDEGDD